MFSEQFFAGFGTASWSSIFAGSAVAMAVAIVMAIMGVALGFSVVKPKDHDPTAHLGAAFGVWSVISVIVSLGGGAFVAGMFAAQSGALHGFVVWALTLIVAACMGGTAMGMGVRSVGMALRGLGGGTAHMTGMAGKGAGHAALFAAAELKDNISLNVDLESLEDNIQEILVDTGAENLQPEYLKRELKNARADLGQTIHKLTLKPQDYKEIINHFLDSQKQRLDSITSEIDKEAAVNALVNKRQIPRDEAETMVDNAVKAYNKLVDKAKESVSDVHAQVEQAKQRIGEIAEQARDKADKASKMAAKAAWAAGIALILGALLSIGAGHLGATQAPQSSLVETYLIAPDI